MTKRNGVISCSLFLLLTITFDNAAAKQPQKSAEVSGIYLDVLKVSACAAGQGCSTVGGPKQWNLFDLAEGKTDFANQVLMPAKTNELRLILGQKSTITVDGTSYPLSVPSGQASGLKLKGNKIFAKTSGFLKNLKLDFDLAKGLVVQVKKGKGKDKKGAETVAYSYSLKPVIHVSAAEITPMPENMAGVFVMPDESSKLKLGKDFLLSIPVGAVAAPVLITAEAIKYSVEVKDEATGKLVKKTGLASTYDLQPEGTEFVKPIKVSVRYHTDTLPAQRPESDLAVFHDGDAISTEINAVSDIASGNISHFSSVTVSYKKYGECEDEIVEDGIKHKNCGNEIGYPDLHVMLIDRVKLKDKYKLRIFADDAGGGEFRTHTVKDFAKDNNAIVAINASLFGPQGIDYYKENELANPTYSVVMNGILKNDYPKSEVIVSFGEDSRTSSIPINIITKGELIKRFDSPVGELPDGGYEDCSYIENKVAAGYRFNTGNYIDDISSCYTKEWESSCENVIDNYVDSFSSYGDVLNVSLDDHHGFVKNFFDCQSRLWENNPSKVTSFESPNILSWAIGTDATLLEINGDNTESTCRYTDTSNDLSFEQASSIGYSDNKIVFVSSDTHTPEDRFISYSDICEVFRVHGKNIKAVNLDGGCSTQLVINGELKNGYCNYMENGPRHVVNAIGLIPKDQPDDDINDGSGDNGDNGRKTVKIEEDKARCGGTDDYWHKQNIGSDGKSLWTYNNDSSHGVDNYCTYEFDRLERGKKWEVKVYIPSEHATTRHACYEISDGEMPVGAEIDQSTVYNKWVSLGVFEAEGDFLKVSLTDMTGEGYGDHWVGFDAIKIVPAPDDAKVGLHDGVDSCEPRL